MEDELEMYEVSNNTYHSRYTEIIEKLKKKYKNISDNLIRDELCFILRDKILKYYTYKLIT